MKPKKVNIFSKEYEIVYLDKPSDVDIDGKEALWGQIDPWIKQIRVYDNKKSLEDVWHTIIHEIIHGLVHALHLDTLEDDEEAVDRLALGLTDVFFRNGWLKLDKK